MTLVQHLFVVLALTSLLASFAQGDKPAPFDAGEHLVGHFETTIVDRSRDNRALPLHIWHPADRATWNAKPDFSFFPLFVKVGITSKISKNDVAVESGIFPLLIFSHGFESIPTQSLGLMEHLASHGFVVVSISHTGNVQGDASSENPLADRYPDVVATINVMGLMNESPSSRLHQHVDSQNVGVLGHSFGGLTAQLMATGYGQIPADARVRAIMPIATASQPISDAGLRLIKIPTLLLVGTLDKLQPETARGFQLISSGANLFRVDIVGANHTHFANVCEIGNALIDAGIAQGTWRFIGAKALIEPYNSTCVPPAYPIAEALRIQNLYATAHFRTFLHGETEYRKYLTQRYATTHEPDVRFFRGAAKPQRLGRRTER